MSSVYMCSLSNSMLYTHPISQNKNEYTGFNICFYCLHISCRDIAFVPIPELPPSECANKLAAFALHQLFALRKDGSKLPDSKE